MWGSAVVPFNLTSKWAGRTGSSTFKKPVFNRDTGKWTYPASLKVGSWSTVWGSHGMTNSTVPKPGQAISLPVRVSLPDGNFEGVQSVRYTATAGRTGTAK